MISDSSSIYVKSDLKKIFQIVKYIKVVQDVYEGVLEV